MHFSFLSTRCSFWDRNLCKQPFWTDNVLAMPTTEQFKKIKIKSPKTWLQKKRALDAASSPQIPPHRRRGPVLLLRAPLPERDTRRQTPPPAPHRTTAARQRRPHRHGFPSPRPNSANQQPAEVGAGVIDSRRWPVRVRQRAAGRGTRAPLKWRPLRAVRTRGGRRDS